MKRMFYIRYTRLYKNCSIYKVDFLYLNNEFFEVILCNSNFRPEVVANGNALIQVLQDEKNGALH